LRFIKKRIFILIDKTNIKPGCLFFCSVDDNAAPPTFTDELATLTLNEGEKLILKCNVSGNPDPDVDWFHDGKV
jgi:hypothetical protein